MQTSIKTFSYKRWLKPLLILSIVTVGLVVAGHAFAEDTSGSQNLGDIAIKVTDSFSGLAKLLIAVSYIAGIGFVLSAIFKFKQHKDNPTQIPLGTPLAMLVIGIALVFLPMIFGPAGTTLFGKESTTGGVTGSGFSKVPGSDGGTSP